MIRKIILIASFMFITGALYAQSLKFDSEVRVTPTSGYTGALLNVNAGEFSFDEIIDDSEGGYKQRRTVFAGIREISWSEKADKPCKIKAKSYALDHSISGGTSKTKSICSGSGGSEKTVKLTTSRHFIRGIAVCTTDKRDSSKNRLKGIRIYPALVSDNGTVTNLNNYEEVRRTNCPKRFKPAVFCPTGFIASGLRVYHNTDSFRGVGLRCRRVIVSTTPFK